jgi:hypothetical protein
MKYIINKVNTGINHIKSFLHQIRSTASYYSKEGKYKDTRTVKVLKELPIVMGFVILGYCSVIELDTILHTWTDKEIIRSFLIWNAIPVYEYFIRLYMEQLIEHEYD